MVVTLNALFLENGTVEVLSYVFDTQYPRNRNLPVKLNQRLNLLLVAKSIVL